MANPFEVRDDPADTKRKQHLANDQLAADEFIRNVLKTRSGRKFFWRFLELTHIFEISWVPGSFDSTAFREGERNVGQRMLADIVRVAPEAWLEMMKEHHQKTAPAAPDEKEEGDDA